MQQSIFVGNIPYGALESELAQHFSQIGEVIETKFVIDWKRGRFRGYGFVTMASSDAQRALRELQQSKFQDRLLNLSLARSANREQPARAV